MQRTPARRMRRSAWAVSRPFYSSQESVEDLKCCVRRSAGTPLSLFAEPTGGACRGY